MKAIQEKYGSIGYVFADVKAENRFLDEPGQLDLVYNITEGDRYRVGRINVEIKGENPHTQITTVLNRLSLKPGDIVDIRELRASERRLKASGLFLVDPDQGRPSRRSSSARPSWTTKTKNEVAGRPKRQTPFIAVRAASRTTRAAGRRSRAPSLPPPRPGERYVDVLVQYEHADDYWRDQQDRRRPAARHPAAATAGGNGVPTGGLPPGRLSRGPAARWPRVAGGDADGGSRSVYGNGGVQHARSAAATVHRRGHRTRPSGYHPAVGVRAAAVYQPSSRRRRTAGSPIPRQAGSRHRHATLAAVRIRSNTRRPAAAITVAPAPPTASQVSRPSHQPPAGTPTAGLRATRGGRRHRPARNSRYTFRRPVGVAPPPQLPPSQHVFGNPDRWHRPLRPTASRCSDLPLTIRTEETQTGRLMFGVGVNSDAGLVGSIVFDEQNFDWTRFPTSWEDIRNATAWRGAGQRFRIEAVPGTQVQRYMVNFQEPYLFDYPRRQPGPERLLLRPHLHRMAREPRRRPHQPGLPVHPRPDRPASPSAAMNVNISNPEFARSRPT